ncbi:hypothetical protein T01_12576 [Trichinella spiralis]|uniref:Uncharacterized protein n=1 Tax=Trichinella spiralis TaxID=6334 RepID=A0A0V1B2S0_TRISP|nr:hypothetical protein T01_12576 [Trichinella spiralis]
MMLQSRCSSGELWKISVVMRLEIDCCRRKAIKSERRQREQRRDNFRNARHIYVDGQISLLSLVNMKQDCQDGPHLS